MDYIPHLANADETIREQARRRLHRYVEEGVGLMYSHDDAEAYFRFECGECDQKKELMKSFENEEVVDYLLSIFTEGEINFIILVLLMVNPALNVNPTLAFRTRLERFPIQERLVIFDNIIEIYRRSGQEIKCKMAKRAKNYYIRCYIGE